MELHLAGTEVHELRETLESVLSGLQREIAAQKGAEARKALETRRDTIRSILEKFPVGLTEVG
ncbi:MAG TPA: hypothetical protein VFU42_07990 [Candidatus Deferrimicrobiaceae bacterium]|nr:hypothetical protein [Candidatus Deferrimicrobiaceae bacterium]